MSEYDEDLNNEAKEIVDDNFNVDKEIIDILKDMLNSKNLELKTEIPKKEFEKIYRLAILKNEIKRYSPKSYKLISSLLTIRFKYSLSKDRQSRKEILDSIKSMVMRNSLTQAEIENNQKRRFWR